MERTLMWRICQGIARIFTTSWFDLKTYDAENIPTHGGALLVANHQSYLDPILVAVHLRRPVSFMARSSLFRHPFLNWLIRSLHAFPVRRGEADITAIKECVRQLQSGNILNVYPEGSRTETGQIGPIIRGVTLIIRKAAVPVIPVAIDGSFQAWPKGQTLFRPHPIRVIYGNPMQLHHLTADEIVAAIDTSWRTLLKKLQEKNDES